MRSSWALQICLLWRRLKSDIIALFNFLRRASGVGGAELFYLESSDRTHGYGLKDIRGCLDWTFGSISLLGVWSNAETGFLEWWSMPWASQMFRRNLDNGVNILQHLHLQWWWSGSWCRLSLEVPSSCNYSSLFTFIHTAAKVAVVFKLCILRPTPS